MCNEKHVDRKRNVLSIRWYLVMCLGVILLGINLALPSKVLAFRFVSWGDTKGGTSGLAAISQQAKALNPAFTIYTGDLESDGSTANGLAVWERALNGGSSPGNGMSLITFPVRGNHDIHIQNTTGLWQDFFDTRSVAQGIGAINYTPQLNDPGYEDLTYSFDYPSDNPNSHFVGIDAPGSATMVTDSQTRWLDDDLTVAENRGLRHAFIFFHGPIYYVNNHSSGVPSGLISVLNKHPIVSATFHGHEHVMAYVHIDGGDSGRIPSVTRPFEEFVTGAGGAGAYACTPGRSDYCVGSDESIGSGFATVDVNGDSFTVSIYLQGHSTASWARTFTKAGGTPQPTATPGGPTATPTPVGCQTAYAGGSWVNKSMGANQTGTFTTEFDATPSPRTGDTVGDMAVGLSNGSASAYTDLAAIVRFAPSGNIDARNGGSYGADTTIGYIGGSTYHVRMTVDVQKRTYSVYVSPSGSSQETRLANNYAFRSEQGSVTQLNNWAVNVNTGAGYGGTLQACSFTLSGVTATPTLTRTPTPSIPPRSFLASYRTSNSALDKVVDGVVNLLDLMKLWYP